MSCQSWLSFSALSLAYWGSHPLDCFSSKLQTFNQLNDQTIPNICVPCKPQSSFPATLAAWVVSLSPTFGKRQSHWHMFFFTVTLLVKNCISTSHRAELLEDRSDPTKHGALSERHQLCQLSHLARYCCCSRQLAG